VIQTTTMKPDHICKYLRTKKMYIPAQAHEVFESHGDQNSNSCHWWCNCTLTEVGPDDRPVGLEVCTSSRPCFEE
jgi:hypothetical protein